MSFVKMAAAMDAPEDDCIGKGHILDAFKEIDEIYGLIDSIKVIYKDQIAVETACERFTLLVIIDQYQEQPHLIDRHLETLMSKILGTVRNPDSPPQVKHLAFKFLYLVTKLRGYKIIVRQFPHEVSDVEPVIALLKAQNPEDFETWKWRYTWESRYVLLLWLSMVCMIPFDMVRLDSNAVTVTGEKQKPVMDRILDLARTYLTVNDKSRDAAAYLASKFLTRPDVKKQRLPEFLDWSLQVMNSADLTRMEGMIQTTGIMTMLALLFKQGKREDLLEYAPVILKNVQDLKLKDSGNTFLRKAFIKVIQRLGLTFLKNRVAAWRYDRGNRSLADNLTVQKGNTNASQSKKDNQDDGDDEEEYDIPDELEDVIGNILYQGNLDINKKGNHNVLHNVKFVSNELLLGGLRDKDTIVRWSAAKGIGRITGRLPKELADDVVGSVLQLFTLQETDGAWHGGCLALAELGRRGLLLPERLPDALVYDEKRGSFSVGAHVRDAACYVCWAFARAYDPQEIKPYVTKIAIALVKTSIFDREVNVRRAAAAAFQENVGRQGTFPQGIDILTIADYFAVGNRTSCYTELSVIVAQFPEYTVSMIEHIVEMKMGHWDSDIRVLTSKALHNLTPKAVEYMSKEVFNFCLPKTIPNTVDIDLSLRHGAILAAAEITYALAKIAHEQNKLVTSVVDTETINGLKNIVKKLNDDTLFKDFFYFLLSDDKLFKGLGGELMSKLSSITCITGQFRMSTDLWQDTLDDCLKHDGDPEVQSDMDIFYIQIGNSQIVACLGKSTTCAIRREWKIKTDSSTETLSSGRLMAAVSAIPAFFSEYYRQSSGEAIPEKQEYILQKYLNELKSAQEINRKGYALALGALPKFKVHGKLKEILDGLINASKIKENKTSFAEARSDALKSIARLCKTVGVQTGGLSSQVICKDNIPELYDCFFVAMKDYTLDSRGDVGAWVREASMSGLLEVTSLIVNSDPSLITSDICEKLFCCLVQQACEKIDRTRSVAGSTFIQLLYHKPEIPHIPHRTDLEKIFPQSEVDSINWAAPSDTFARFTKLLHFKTYLYSVLLGLTVSVGGLTESLVKFSSIHLQSYLRDISKDIEQMTDFTNVLIQIFKDYQKVDRVSLPLLKMLDMLFSRGCFDVLDSNHPFPVEVLEAVKKEITRTGDPHKLLAAADVYCGLLQFEGEVRKKCLQQISILMCHRYPRVRKQSANKLYEVFVTYDDIAPEENLDEIITIVSETQCIYKMMDEPVEELKPLRNKLCDLLNIPKPVLMKKSTTNTDDTNT
ncbi:hypothetical protein KUTeg_003982 [Tegillarca granosa]|uniref:Tubulin-specific chaperone D n=1 Tax=Tegillarca granosa TaxID=220873 RepID=A0ABQ9FNM8_TEGGR|nr:hypothetical protein KUTeg_003982 [Tegillarca granosa]